MRRILLALLLMTAFVAPARAQVPTAPASALGFAAGDFICNGTVCTITMAGGGMGTFNAGILTAGTPPSMLALGDGSFAESNTCGKFWLSSLGLGEVDYGCTVASRFSIQGGGVNIPSASSLTLGTIGSAAGSISINGATSGTAVLQVPAAAGTPAVVLPTVNTTFPAAQPGTAGMAVVATAAGVQSYAAMEAYVSYSGLLGVAASTAADTLLVACTTATRAGHVVDMTCTDDFLTACTTAPQFKPRNNTTPAVGTVTTCPNTAGQTTTAETLTFAAGEQICIVRTTNGGTCTVPAFAVVMHLSFP